MKEFDSDIYKDGGYSEQDLNERLLYNSDNEPIDFDEPSGSDDPNFIYN